MRGWQQGGLAGHCGPFPLARFLSQDSVMVLSTSNSLHCGAVLQRDRVMHAGGFQEKPTEFSAYIHVQGQLSSHPFKGPEGPG